MADRPDREAKRQANFAQAQKTSPLLPSIADVPLPGGLELGEDEIVVRTAKDWGVSISLVLTTRRLICPTDLTGRTEVSIPLTDVRDVQLRKHWVGFATIVVNWTDQPPASFPAHINGARMRVSIAGCAHVYRNNLKRPRSRVSVLIRQGRNQQDVAKVLTGKYKWAPDSVYAMDPARIDD